MKRSVVINEAQLSQIIRDCLNERKVLKLGGNKSQSMGMNMPPMPQGPQQMGGGPNGGMPPMDDSMGGGPNGGMPPMDDSMGGGSNGGMPPMDDSMGENDGATSGQSDFDTDFDAGVEADEDTDPKKFIQQLTGKLSQSLSKYNNDNGIDNGLCKYVANMIVKQAAKGLDEKDRKDIIKAINTTAQDNSDEMPDEDDDEMPIDDNGDDMPMDDEQQPMQECCFSKRQIRKMFENINPSQEWREEDRPYRNKKNNTPFNGKIY